MSRQWQRDRMRRKRASIARERQGRRVVRWFHGGRDPVRMPIMRGLTLGYLAEIERGQLSVFANAERLAEAACEHLIMPHLRQLEQRVTKWETCPACSGTGRVELLIGDMDCTACSGGMIRVQTQEAGE